MSASGIRDLSPEELALISGGAQVDTNDLPPVEVRPPDDWGPNPDPPDWGEPWDPGDSGGGGGGGGTSDPSFTFTDVKPFESKLTYSPGEGANTATITIPISTSSGQLSAITELKFNTDGSFQNGKGALNYVGDNGTLLNWELRESNWSFTTTGGYYWDLGNGYGFKLTMSYDTSNNDLKGQAEFLYNKHP